VLFVGRVVVPYRSPFGYNSLNYIASLNSQ
jgi:hypothetical protein